MICSFKDCHRSRYDSIHLLYSEKLLYMSKCFESVQEQERCKVFELSPSIDDYTAEKNKLIDGYSRGLSRMYRQYTSNILDSIFPEVITNIIMIYTFPKAFINTKRYLQHVNDQSNYCKILHGISSNDYINGSINGYVNGSNSKYINIGGKSYINTHDIEFININGAIVIVCKDAAATKEYNVLLKNKKVVINNIFEPAYIYYEILQVNKKIHTKIWVKDPKLNRQKRITR